MRAIILAGGPTGRPSGTLEELPRPFWPLVMRPLVLRLIDHLIQTGVHGASVCANGHTELFSDQLKSYGPQLEDLHFTRDPLPRGPAGCIKDNESFLGDESFLVFGAACWLRDSAESLLERHRQQGNKLTVFCLPDRHTPSGVYAGEPEILQHIPALGYCDIKEQLVPRLLERKIRVGALPLRAPAAEVVNARSYLLLHRHVLNELAQEEADRHPERYVRTAQDVWIARSAQVSPRARLIGPIIVGPGSVISDRALVIGPTIIGPRAVVGQEAILADCVLWEGAVLSRGKNVSRTVIPPQPLAAQSAEIAHSYIWGGTQQEIGAYA